MQKLSDYKYSVFIILQIFFLSFGGRSFAQNLDLNQTEADFVQQFIEQSIVSVTTNQVLVDYLVGTSISIGSTVVPPTNYSGSGSFLLPGFYDSHLLHLDGIGTSGSISVSGTVAFPGEIVGFISSNSGSLRLLEASDSVFGVASVFDSSDSRRLETNDSITLVDANTINYTFFAGRNFTDNLRIITKPLEASLESSKIITVHSSGNVDCAIIPGVPEAGLPVALPGACIEYLIQVENIGLGTAFSFSIEDFLDTNLIFRGADISGFPTSEPGYTESLPAFGTSCGGSACLIGVYNTKLDPGDVGNIIVRAEIK